MAKGAFGPSFADSDDTEQPKEDEQEKTKGKGKSKRKMTTGESSAKCPACGLHGHTLENCLYVFPERAKGSSIHVKTGRRKSIKGCKRMISSKRRLTDFVARNRRKERQTKTKIDSYGGLEQRGQASIL